jgi:hypothetical protein
MKKVFLALLAIATALAISPLALAQNYSFTFSTIGPGPDYPAFGSGILYDDGGLVTSWSGTYNGSPMTLLPPNPGVGGNPNTGNPGYAGNDNQFNPSGSPSYFSFNGLSFEADSIYYNLFYVGSTGTYLLDSNENPVGNTSPSTEVGFSATYVPDGGTTVTLLGLAVAGLAGLRRKLSK